MFPKLTASVLVAFAILCLSLNGSVAKSFFDDITKKNVVLNMDKSCAVTAEVAKLNRKNANAVPKLDDVVFELRTPCKTERYTMSEAEKLLKNPAFNVDRITAVLIAPNIDDEYVQKMAEAFSCRQEYNFLAVDTANYLKGEEYVRAAINVEILGEHIAQGLKNSDIDSENIYLIGHGLGAHTAGSAGAHYVKLEGEQVARITALDPSRPCFKSGALRKLQIDDATFVDVIHSNPGLLGLEDPMGNADFYPEGMELIKPGCDEHYICSHQRSVGYFIETVIPGQANNFLATKCNDLAELKANTCSGTKVPMGYSAQKAEAGIYTLSVKPTSPYGNEDTGKGQACNVCKN